MLRYLKGTIGWRLRLGGSEPVVAAFTDADWGGDLDDRRSIGAYVLKVGDGAVSWKSKKQTCVALSSTEAEYVALCQVSKEAEWMLDFLKGLGIPMDSAMVVHVDNQGVIALAKNLVFRTYPVTSARYLRPGVIHSRLLSLSPRLSPSHGQSMSRDLCRDWKIVSLPPVLVCGSNAQVQYLDRS